MFEYSRTLARCCSQTAERFEVFGHGDTFHAGGSSAAHVDEESRAYFGASVSDASVSDATFPDARPQSATTNPETPGHRLSDHERLTSLSSLDPGPHVMSALAGIDVSSLCGSDAIVYLQVHDRVSSWWAAQQVEALVRAAGPERHVDKVVLFDNIVGFDARGSVTIVDAVREEIAAAMRWAPSTAQRRIDSARLLSGPMANTRRALSTGAITPAHASTLVAAAQRFDGEWSLDESVLALFRAQCRSLESRVLPVAVKATVARTRQAAARSVHSVDPAGTLRRRNLALHQRDVFVVDEHDGISLLLARMSTEQAHACLSVVNTIVRVPRCEKPEEHTAIGVRRAEALAHLLLSSSLLPSPQHMTSRGNAEGIRGSTDTAQNNAAMPIKAHVDIVIDLATLLGLQDGAAELLGAGPIPAEVARELFNDGTMRRIVTDPLTGHQLDYGRRVYAVPQRLREFVASRDRTCRFPGCARAAGACQIDHAEPWNEGGQTTPANLGALCTRHHQLKTHGGWAIEDSDATGSCTWVSPQGRRYPRVATNVLDTSRLPPSTASPDPPPF